MFSNVFLKTLRDVRVALVLWSVGIALMCLWIVTLYPEIGAEFQQYLENFPESMKVLIGESASLASLEGFLAVELYTLFYPLLVLVFGLSYGGGLISREEDEGSLDLLLSNPVPRWRVVLEKFAALVVFVIVVLLATYGGLALGALIANVEMDYRAVFDATLNVLPLVLFFSTLALMLTCLKRGRGLAVGVSAGLAAVTYLSNGMAAISDIPEWVQKLSPWYYYAGDSVIADGMHWGNFWILLGLAAAFVVIGMWGFQQRDLGV